MCILIDKWLAVFLNSSFTSKFFGLKIDFFKKKKNGLRVIFYKLTFKWLQTGLSDLKNTIQLKFCFWWIFTHF